jgi:L-iditol 2-dehydrogenase
MAVRSAAHPNGLVRTKAQVLDGARTLRMHDLPLDPVSPLHVQVRIHSVGLSDSDLMHFTTLSNDGISLRAPLIVGQEATGEITVVGAMVAQTYPHLQVGLKVAIEPSIPCRTCQKCIAGKYNICLNMLVAASGAREPYVHGFLREYANWPGEMVHP